MSNHLKKFLSIITVFILFCSCQSTSEKMNEFVEAYNNSANTASNGFITTTKAEISKPDEITITIESSLEQSESNKVLFGKILPNIVGNTMNSKVFFRDLINDNVKFNMIFKSDAGFPLATILVDKNKLEELLKDKPSKPTDEVLPPQNKSLSPELNQVLSAMRESLPIEDKANGTTITDINVENENTMVYKIEVSDSDGLILKSDEAQAMMKKDMLKDNTLRKGLISFKKYGITIIKYQYMGKKGDIFAVVEIDRHDLR